MSRAPLAFRCFAALLLAGAAYGLYLLMRAHDNPSAQPGAVSAIQRTDWPSFQHDPQLTGVADHPFPPPLKLMWSRDLGKGIRSSAAIVGERIVVGTDGGSIVALAVRDGSVLWTHVVGKHVSASPLVQNDRVYVGDEGGRFRCIRLDDGSPLWSAALGDEEPIHASATPWGDTVLVGSYDFHLYAFDAETGRERWRFRTNERVHTTPAVRDGLAYIAGCDGRLRAIAIDTGQQAFSVDVGGYTGSAATLTGELAVLGSQSGRILAIDADTQSIRWDTGRRYEMPVQSSAALAGDAVIFTDLTGTIRSLAIADGRERWSLATPASFRSSPVVAGAVVYAAGSDGVLRAVSADSGKLLWQTDLGSSTEATPAIGQGLLVLGTDDGALFAFAAADSLASPPDAE